MLEDFIGSRSLCLLNDGSDTFLHPAYKTCSAIDLTIVDPMLYLDYSWHVQDDRNMVEIGNLQKLTGQLLRNYVWN